MPEPDAVEINDSEGRQSEDEMYECNDEDGVSIRSDVYESLPEFTELSESMRTLTSQVEVEVEVLRAIDELDAKVTDPPRDDVEQVQGDSPELKRMMRTQQTQTEDFALQARKGRIYTRSKGWMLAVVLTGTLSGLSSAVITVLTYLQNQRKNTATGTRTSGGTPEDTDVPADLQLTKDQQEKMQGQLERWWALEDGAVWAKTAELVDKRNLSLQGQVIMLDMVKRLSAPLLAPFIWPSAEDKVGAVKKCIAAFDGFDVPGRPKSQALYGAVAGLRYQGGPLPRQVAAGVIQLALHQIIAARTGGPEPDLHFPARNGGPEASVYAGTYLQRTRRASHQPPAFRALLDESTGPLPLLDQREFTSLLSGLLSGAEPDLCRQLQDMVTRETAVRRQSHPLLRGERIEEDYITALAEPWRDRGQHALVYYRRTNLGELAVIPIASATSTATSTGVAGNSAATTTMDIVRQSLTTVSMIAFACGPEGVIVGAGGLILNTILSIAFPPEQVDLPKAISDLVKQDLADDHLLQAAPKILAYTTWISEYAKAKKGFKFTSKEEKAYQSTFAELKKNVEDALSPGSPLLQTISELQNGTYPSTPEFQYIALPLFCLAASTHLTMLQVDILLTKDDDATTWHSPKTAYFIEAATRYADHIRDSLKVVYYGRYNKRMTDRVDGTHKCDYLRAKGLDADYHYFKDDHAGEFPQRHTETLLGGPFYDNCYNVAGHGESYDDVEKSRNDYWLGVDQEFKNAYCIPGSRAEDLGEVWDELRELIARYSEVVS
ncbi:insecticidal delta-endotoxin Cry8Ea1 family protein [Streptomyces sp. NPDC056716]|uniref:insecticidal delta-endotoxin Cry8Ea1 family protein n=1 Tax=unclassified Streptomyces TaxID=2593676 RepID=UPI0036B180F6